MKTKRRGFLQGLCCAVVASAMDIFGVEVKEITEPAPLPFEKVIRPYRIVDCSEFHPSYGGQVFTNTDPKEYNPAHAQEIFTGRIPEDLSGGPGEHDGSIISQLFKTGNPSDFYRSDGWHIVDT